MKNLLLLLALTPSLLFSQVLTQISPLSTQISESSGLIHLAGKIITLNDSGGTPELYEIDNGTGEILRTVTLQNATNVDWESITHDDDYIYIGDIGNNDGTRTDLNFYKIEISDFFQNEEVVPEKIEYYYSDQIGFTPDNYATNYDAEASIILGDSIYIFTKNWGDFWTNIYSLPKEAGNHEAKKIGSIDVEGMITGATIDNHQNKIILTGYSFSDVFIQEVVKPNSTSGSIVFEPQDRYEVEVPTSASRQIEGICTTNAFEYYLSSESTPMAQGGLFKLDMKPTTAHIDELEEQSLFAYPNPTHEMVTIDLTEMHSCRILNLEGKEFWNSVNSDNNLVTIDVSQWGAGVYMISTETNDEVNTIKLIVQ